MPGGRSAILGLLYELTVTIHVLSIQKFQTQSSNRNFDGFDLNAFVESRDIGVLSQYCETDLTLTSDDGITILQCKATESERRISKNEFIEILVEGAKQLKQIRNVGDQRGVTAFLLVTNRKLANNIQSIEEELRAEAPSLCRKTSPAPHCLAGRSDSPSIFEWCSSIRDSGSNLTISSELAQYVSDLLICFKFVSFSTDLSRAAFNHSMRMLGMKGVEIHSLSNDLAAALLHAQIDGIDVANLLRKQLSLCESFHTLCPENLQPLLSSRFETLRHGSGLEPSEVRAGPDQLPRRVVWRDLFEQFQDANRDPKVKALVLLGDGGTGKTKIAFDLPAKLQDDLDQTAVEIFFVCSHKPPNFDLVGSALLPFFECYSYVNETLGGNLLIRLHDAFDACHQTRNIWIVVPNSDELTGEEFRLVMDRIYETPEGVRFILTVRSRVWPSGGRWADLEWCRTMEISIMDRQELFEWFHNNGAYQQSSSTKTLSILNTSSFVPQRASGDSVSDGCFDHPLAFAALREWAASLGLLKRQISLQGLLNGEPTPLQNFMEFSKSSYCTRVCKNISADQNDVLAFFDSLSQNRFELPAQPPAQIASIYGQMFTSSAEASAVLEQFIQIGIIRKNDDSIRSLSWALPYEDPSIVNR